MFTPQRMERIDVFVREPEVQRVVLALARLEVLELSGVDERAWTAGRRRRWSKLAQAYSDQAERIETVLDTLGIPPGPGDFAWPEHLDPKHDASELEERLCEIEPRVRDAEERKTRLEEERERLSLMLEWMRLLSPLDLSLDSIRDSRHLYLTAGTMFRDKLEGLDVILFHIPFVLIPFYEREDRVVFFAATVREHGPILDRALRSVFTERLEVPDEPSGSPAERVQSLEHRLEELDREHEELETALAELRRDGRERLLSLWRRVQANAAVTATVDRLGYREGIYLISGWVPARDLGRVIDEVREAAEGRADVEVLAPPALGRPQVPTRTRNPRLLRPFENLVSTFGLPAYQEIDPTPLVAATFLLMYGVMFGDLGHGLLLALAGALVRARSKSESWATLGSLIIASGVSAALVGFLYGSVFGREDVLPRIWLSPLQHISSILITSVIGGIVLLNLGFLLHLVNAWRAGDWQRLSLGRNGLAGIALYWGILAGALSLWRPLVPPAVWGGVLFGSAAALFLREPLARLAARERPLVETSWGEYGIRSFFELFETMVSDISNSFSFLRLGAFAVAHAGLSQIVFSLADLVQANIWRWLVVILGTALIIVFEGFIVGIQALRLEYYEFFSRFFEGGGRSFVPFGFPTMDSVRRGSQRFERS